MNKKHLIYALITAIVFSTASYANNRHERNGSHHSNHQSKHSYNNSHNNRHDSRHNNRHDNRGHQRNYNSNKHYNNGNAPFSTYGYNQPYRNNYNYRNRNRNKNYRHYKRHQNYNNNYRRYNNYNSYNNNYYNNYQPYYQSQYTYRPLRGLGHYYTDDNYGYGHWHDNNWCSIQHTEDYYYNYYSNYPYQNGWTFGDGDFGISFYIN